MIEADFETRSDIDLGKHGAYVYWESPNARVLLGSFKHGDTRFRWRYGEPCPPMLQYNIEAGGMIAAHNASFEALCFRWLHDNCGWPMPRPEQFRCTAATAAAMQLPRKLEWLGEALGLSVQKDKEGMRLIRKFSIPQKDGQFIPPEADPADFEKFHAYCDTDVETEAEADSRMVPLSDYEQSVYTLSEKINNRGIRIDIDSARAALRIAEKAKVQMDRQMAQITGGAVRKCSEVAKLTEWVGEQGVAVDSLAKADIDDVLAAPDLPSHVREALEVRQEAAKTSVAKLQAMIDRASRDGRVRGTFMYHGAGTGRWTSMGVNFANMPRSRKCFEGIRQDVLFEAIKAGDPDYLRFLYGPEVGRPLHLLSDAVRGFIMAAPGHELVQADYSNIEGSVVAWLANEEWKLEAIRDIFADPDNKPDMYRRTAAAILGLPIEEVTKKHWSRQAVGKPAELACLSGETKVLTSNGVKSITEVSTSDLLWDGIAWVTHQGVISKGVRQTVSVGGIRATPDHLFLTPRGWAQAQELGSDPNMLAQALVTGSANLPSSVSTKGCAAACATSSCGAVAALTRISSACQIFARALRRAAPRARAKRLPCPGTSSTTATAILSRTTNTESAFLTGSLRATDGASIQQIGATATMAVEAYRYSGGATGGLFWPTSSHLKAGMTRLWNWTASTLTAITRRATCGSSPARTMLGTSAKRATCPTASENWKPKLNACEPVFDILNAGPLNRFTVCADDGFAIVHNCGYQGGVSAFYTFARNGGVDFGSLGASVLAASSEEQIAKAQKRYEANFKRNQARARELSRDAWVACEIIKNGWRAQNAAIAKSWHDLEAAAREAVENPGTVTEAAKTKYIVRFGYLWPRLPSGRCLCYGAPWLKAQVWVRLTLDDGSWSEAEVMDQDTAEAKERKGEVKIDGATSDKVTVMGTDSVTKKWRRYALYGGILCENNTQAVARDILVNGMFKAEAAGYPVIAHVYDEIIAEVPRGFGDLADFERLICELPPWAEGLPIAAGGFRAKRYKKD